MKCMICYNKQMYFEERLKWFWASVECTCHVLCMGCRSKELVRVEQLLCRRGCEKLMN